MQAASAPAESSAREELAVVLHLKPAAQLGVFIFEHVEAMRAVGEHARHAVLGEHRLMFSAACSR